MWSVCVAFVCVWRLCVVACVWRARVECARGVCGVCVVFVWCVWCGVWCGWCVYDDSDDDDDDNVFSLSSILFHMLSRIPLFVGGGVFLCVYVRCVRVCVA
jgi:hypothetical protein